MESWALIFLRLRVMAHGVVWWADAFPWKRWWCLAMIVVVSCCNLFLVGVWRWLLLFRVAWICFSLHVVRFSFDFDTCADCFSGCVCAFLVPRLAFVAICFALRVFHNWTVMRFSSQFGICCVSVSVARSAFLVSCFAWAFRVSCLVFPRFSFHFDICYLFLVARISGSHITMEWLRGQLNCYAFLVSLCGICCVRVSRYVFRVSRFTLAFVAIFFSLRVCVSRFTLAFDDDQKLCKMDFQRVVQDGVQECRADVAQDGSCARCCARWCARCYARWLECVWDVYSVYGHACITGASQ